MEEDEFLEANLNSIFTHNPLHMCCEKLHLLSQDLSMERKHMEQEITKTLFTTYRRILVQYSKRYLTMSEDILRAFSGITGALSKAGNVEFVSGHPTMNFAFHLSLLWTPIGKLPHQRSRTGPLRSSGKTRFPSWSWLSGIGEFDFLVPNAWPYKGTPESEASVQNHTLRPSAVVLGIQDEQQVIYAIPPPNNTSSPYTADRFPKPQPIPQADCETLHLFCQTILLRSFQQAGGRLLIPTVHAEAQVVSSEMVQRHSGMKLADKIT